MGSMDTGTDPSPSHARLSPDTAMREAVDARSLDRLAAAMPSQTMPSGGLALHEVARYALCKGWPEGFRFILSRRPEAMESAGHGWRQRLLVETLAGASVTAPPLSTLPAILEGPLQRCYSTLRFFSSPSQMTTAAVALCNHPARHALWDTLATTCPPAAQDLADVLLLPQTRLRFMGAMLACWRRDRPEDAPDRASRLDFIATRLRWKEGIAVQLATVLVSTGQNVRPDWSSAQEWSRFLQRHPDKAAAFAREVRQASHLDRLLLALGKYRPPADARAWLATLVPLLPKAPTTTARRQRPVPALRAPLAAACAESRLASAPAPSQSRRRRA